MNILHRRVTMKLYPSASQADAMENACGLHRMLYNAALQERIDAWRVSKTFISFAEQCKSITQIRRDDPAYLRLNAQSLQVTLKRLDKAFSHFFRRVKAGETPGFPRYKGRNRFHSFGFKTHCDGFKFAPDANWRNGRLYLSGIGTMRARGEARTPGKIVCADILHKVDGWYLSMVVECEPHRERTGNSVAGLDWGVNTLATLCYGPGDFSEIPNDRLYQQEQDALKAAQRSLSSHLRCKRSKRAARARRLLAKRSRKLANRRRDRNHKTTARLVATHAVIITEKLSVKNMTASAKNTSGKPARNTRQKAGLNREVLDTTPGSWISHLHSKAEESGCRVILVDPRKYKPSQTDPISGVVRKKSLNERIHILPNGAVIGRDQAAAWVLWNIGQQILASERDSSKRAGSSKIEASAITLNKVSDGSLLFPRSPCIGLPPL